MGDIRGGLSPQSVCTLCGEVVFVIDEEPCFLLVVLNEV